jgi:o-succinylbenzoate synthase
MRIDRIELFHVAMPLIFPWRTAYGEDAAVESVLCRLTSGSVSAWGESSPFAAPCYSPEWGGGVFAICRSWLGPTLLHQDIPSGADLQQRLGMFKGNPFAKAVLDTAWWNLQSRIENKPLHELIGATRDTVAVGADFGVMDSLDDLLAGVGKAVDDGFPRIKLKFRPGWDRDMVAAVRRQHPRQTVHIDCNSGYTLADVPLFQSLDDFELAMIEQPLPHDDVLDHAELQRQIRTPVCLDESVTGLRAARQAIDQQSCRFVNVKPGRVGGLTPAVQIHDLCAQAGIPCWVGGMLESAVGASTCVALAMLPNFTYPADIFPSSRFYVEDLADPAIELVRDAAGQPAARALRESPEPVPSRLDRCIRQSAVLG